MGKVTSFLFGAAVGAVAALLFAPQTGEQSRAVITEKANAVVGEAKDFGAGIPGVAQEAIKTATDKAAGLAKGVTGGAAAAPASTASDDELREKIEAARQRIAAQVKANAEQSQAAAGEVKEAAATA